MSKPTSKSGTSDLNELLAPETDGRGGPSGLWSKLALKHTGIEGRWPAAKPESKSWSVDVIGVAENVAGEAYALLWVSGIYSVHRISLPGANANALVEAPVTLKGAPMSGLDGGIMLVPANEVLLDSGDYLSDLLAEGGE